MSTIHTSATMLPEALTSHNATEGGANDACEWTAVNTFFSLGLVLTVGVNMMAAIVLFRVPLVSMHGRSNPIYLCIRFLNICDIMQALLLLFMPAFVRPDCSFIGGGPGSEDLGAGPGSLAYFAFFFNLISPITTILMALDRCIALYQPFKYRSHLGLKVIQVLLPTMAGILLLICALPFMGFGKYHLVKGRNLFLLDTVEDINDCGDSHPEDRAYVLAMHSVYLISLALLTLFTVAFQYKLCAIDFERKHGVKKRASKRSRNATLTATSICFIFVVCYFPYIVKVLYEASTCHKSSSLVTYTTFFLAFLQPLLNPIVYIATNSRYRNEFFKCIRRSEDMESFDSSAASYPSSIKKQLSCCHSTQGKRSTDDLDAENKKRRSEIRSGSYTATTSGSNGKGIELSSGLSLNSSNPTAPSTRSVSIS